MRLIPGKTKVQIELFRGVSLGDIFVAAVAAVLLVFVVISNLPGKFYITLGVLSLAGLLLVRLDTQPNYTYLLHILCHFGYHRRYKRVFGDKKLMEMSEKGAKEVAFTTLFEEEREDAAALTLTEEPETKKGGKESKKESRAREAEKKAQAKAAAKARKAEDKLLKSKTVSPEVKEEIRARRAKASAESAKKIAQAKDATAKGYDMRDIIAFTDIKDGFIEYGKKYYGAAIEITPVEFRFFSQHRRDNSIENALGRVLRSVNTEYSANIVKIERPIQYHQYLDKEYDKLDQLRESYESGMITEDECKARVEILYDRINSLRYLCNESKILAPFYYIVLYESDKHQLNTQISTAIEALGSGEMQAKRLNTKELAVFLKYTNQVDFDEKEIDTVAPENYALWAMPELVQIKAQTVEVNHIITHNMRLVSYPTVVGDAWLAGVFSMPGTKCVIKCKPTDRNKAIRALDRSLQELRGQYMATGVDSKRIELQGHIETLAQLLVTLQQANESLLDVNIFVTAYDIAATRANLNIVQPPESALPNITNMKKTVRRLYQESSFRLNNMEFDQTAAFIGSQISAWDPMGKQGRGIPSNSLAASFPWIYANVSDEGGINMGSSEGMPVFIDFFRRDSERVNSNMVIVGKSGSGKSYATKSLLTNLAADDSKIFILDPENEYTLLADNLHGKYINVGNAQFGRLNPFQIIMTLDDDESDGSTVSGSYATHLQFLEEFFRQILSDCDKDAMEYLNSLIDRMYTNRGITPETDLSKLRPEDYPIFDDLYDAILLEFQQTDNQYIRSILRVLMNYIAKFSTGGRNANLWNGPSTVTTDENFIVFNFQSLLANRNGSIANAQMLLVLKYVDNEIIKNRDYNTRYKLSRKVVVVIDEAHVFIDNKYPVALDFMFQLAKRIRKYNGMQIVITQNIKDFVGSEEIARKSTAIINACQYSFIFALAPNDMDDLCKLYEKAGGINESEQEQITTAPRGQAFTVMSPTSRTTFHVDATDDVAAMFQEFEYRSRYFSGEDGARVWEEFIAESRERRKENGVEERAPKPVETDETLSARARVVFTELDEEPEPEPPRPRGRITLTELEEEPEPVTVSARETKVTFEEAPASIPVPIPVPTPVPAPVPTPVPTPVPQPMPAPAQNGTEQLLSELLGRFSYDAMRLEIERAVRDEMERKQAAMPVQAPTAPERIERPEPVFDIAQAEAERAALEFEAEPEVGDREVEAQPEAQAEAEYWEDEEEAEDEAEAGEIETQAPAPEEFEEPAFDIMQFLAVEAERLGDVSPISMMETYEETIIEVSLDELIAYNNSQRAKRTRR